MAELNVRSIPWIDSGDEPPLALDRDKRDIISQGVADPLYDYDIVPLTYVNSRWFAFFYRADEADLKAILPKCLELEDDVVEFWYVDHNHTGVGPYGEVGVTIAASCRGQDGKTYYGGYYPYMWLTASTGVAAGREPFGFPKKTAYIITQEHGGKEDDGYGGFGNDYFNFTLERRGYLIHTATGRYDDAELPAKPAFYGDPKYGRMNLRLLTDPSLKSTKWDLTYLPSEITPGPGRGPGPSRDRGAAPLPAQARVHPHRLGGGDPQLDPAGDAVGQPRQPAAGEGPHRPDGLQLRPGDPGGRHHLDPDGRALRRGRGRPALRHAVPVHDAPPLPEAARRVDSTGQREPPRCRCGRSRRHRCGSRGRSV